jgi:HlyD family secretion protein
MRNKIIAAVVIVALLVAGGWWYQRRNAAASAAKNQPRYIMATVKKGDISSTISGTGPVASVNGVTVKANQSGTVSQILAQDGDRVKAGQVIMVLDNPSVKAQYQQAQQDLDSARKSLGNLLHPQDTAVQAQQLKVENARLTLQQRQDDANSLTVTAPTQGIIASVGTTEGSSISANTLLFTIFDDAHPTFVVGLSQSAAALVKPGMNVAVELSGFGKLDGTVAPSGGSATPGTGNRDATVPVSVNLPPTAGLRAGMVGSAVFDVPKADFVVQGTGSVKSVVTEVRSKVAATVDQLAVKEGDRVETGSLMAKLSSDSITLALKQAQNDVKVQEQNLVNLIDPSQDPSGQAQNLQDKINAATNSLAQRQSDMDDLQVKAPVAGQISSLTARVGDKITNNASLFRVADYGAMQVTISVDELDIAKVKQGQSAQITLDALSGKNFTGKVYKINPEGTFKNDIANFDVTVMFDKTDGLMAGMNSTVNVMVENKPGVLWLPAQAVTTRQGKSTVQVLDDKKQLTQKDVQIGIRTSQQVEIVSGLKEGDQVVQTVIRSTTTTGAGGFGGLFGGNRQQGGNVPTTGQTGGPTGGQSNFQGGQGGQTRQGGTTGGSSQGR